MSGSPLYFCHRAPRCKKNRQFIYEWGGGRKKKLHSLFPCPLFGRSSDVSLLKPVLCQSGFWKGASSRLHHAINIWHAAAFFFSRAKGPGEWEPARWRWGKEKVICTLHPSPLDWSIYFSVGACAHWQISFVFITDWCFIFHSARHWLPQQPWGSEKTVHFGTATRLLAFDIEYCPKIHHSIYSFDVCGGEKANKKQNTQLQIDRGKVKHYSWSHAGRAVCRDWWDF